MELEANCEDPLRLEIYLGRDSELTVPGTWRGGPSLSINQMYSLGGAEHLGDPFLPRHVIGARRWYQDFGPTTGSSLSGHSSKKKVETKRRSLDADKHELRIQRNS